VTTIPVFQKQMCYAVNQKLRPSPTFSSAHLFPLSLTERKHLTSSINYWLRNAMAILVQLYSEEASTFGLLTINHQHWRTLRMIHPWILTSQKALLLMKFGDPTSSLLSIPRTVLVGNTFFTDMLLVNGEASMSKICFLPLLRGHLQTTTCCNVI